ncbi:MAG: hypothetical protein RIB46_05955 [Pseudomonadales bacterium]
MNDRNDQPFLDPEAYFGTPDAVLEADDLSVDEKITALTNWANEIRQLQVAEEENMRGPSGLAERLRAVEKALLTLRPDDTAHDAKS